MMTNMKENRPMVPVSNILDIAVAQYKFFGSAITLNSIKDQDRFLDQKTIYQFMSDCRFL